MKSTYYFYFTWFFLIFVFIGVYFESEILILISAVCMFISTIKGIFQDKKEQKNGIPHK